MGKKKITPREWLLAYANSCSEECGTAILALLETLDDNNIPYDICFSIDCGDRDESDELVGSIFLLQFTLAITLRDGKKALIDLDMPNEALGQLEEIPGYGNVPSIAYEWMLKKSYPEFDDEDVDYLYRLSQQSEEDRNRDYQLRLKILDQDTIYSAADKQRVRAGIEETMEFFRKPESEREAYFNSHRQELNFSSMSESDRYAHLKALDKILRPIIGDNGFPNWRDSNFINKILESYQ